MNADKLLDSVDYQTHQNVMENFCQIVSAPYKILPKNELKINPKNMRFLNNFSQNSATLNAIICENLKLSIDDVNVGFCIIFSNINHVNLTSIIIGP